MLGLPKTTEVNGPFPKSQLYKRFEWTASQRESFDADVSHLAFVNWISPRTLPAITEGNEVKEIFVVEVTLKTRDFDIKTINLLAKSIPQKIIYLLLYEDSTRIAVYHTKLFLTDWQYQQCETSGLTQKVGAPRPGGIATLQGLNLDAVWENLVASIGNFQIEEEKTLTEQIKDDEERTKLLRQIKALEQKMNAMKQPRRKREIFLEIQKLKTNNNIYGN